VLIRLAYALLWVAALAYVVQGRVGRGSLGRAATGMAGIAWAVLTGGLIERGLAAGHWPLTNRYEVALWWGWATVALYLLLEASWRERRAGPFVLAAALLVVSYAFTRPATERSLVPLLPALRSVWLQVHVLSSVIGYGAFGAAAGLGFMRLVGQAASAGELERAIARVVGWGFPWLTLGILSGAIWAQDAWGRYWGWDPKETWALVTWLWYLLILHVDRLPGWGGRRLAWLTLFGFGIVFFTFAGVPWLVRTVRLESLHGF